MQLDRIGIRPRLRTAWEAIDLGFALARQQWRPLFLSWAVPSGILFLLLSALLPDRFWWLTITLVWWLKPLWDCAPLYIASRALFGASVTPAQAWRQLPRLLRRELLAWLSWRRLSPTRSADLPVTLLEQLRGAQRSRRLSVLHQNISAGAGWLTMACVHFELTITIGAVGLIALLLPDELGFNPFDFVTERSVAAMHISNAISFLAMALVAPFYTMAGFALYISRRVELEAWDIEIRFRHLAAVTRTQRSGTAAALLLGALLLAAPLATPTAHAQDAVAQDVVTKEHSSTEAQAAQQRIDAILAGPDFHQTITIRNWRFKNQDEDTDDGAFPEWLIRLVEFLEKSTRTNGDREPFFNAASAIRFALWVVLISLLIYSVYRYRDSLRQWLRLPRGPAVQRRPPEVLFGLDVRAASLPDDVLGQVRSLWREQQHRAALSLLYRATLAQLLQRFALPFQDDHTEGECAAIARAAAPRAVADFFVELTRVWQQLAYAHREPGTQQLEQLCAQWHEVFGHAR